MSKIYDTIIQALDELELKYERDDERQFVDTGIHNDSATFQIRLAALEEQEILYCFAAFPLTVPEDKRPAMYELINAINYDGLVGMLTLDPEDGQLVSRMVCTVDEGAVNTTIVKVAFNSIYRNLNENYNAILKILAS